tara:strand:+ start:19 stop:822 length:804 start_codon:yes stop_codon:yes gene_type:complete
MANLPMNFADKIFKEYDDLKNENRKLKNILHLIWDILDDPNLDDEDANMKVCRLAIFDEILKEKEKADKKKDEDESDEDESDEDEEDEDETDYKIINKGKFNHEIKEVKKEKNVYDTPSEEESEEENVVDKVENLLNQLKIPKGFVDEVESFCKELKKKKLDDFSDEESEEEKEKEEEEKIRKLKNMTTKKEEEKAKQNNETMIREYLKERNITKLHFLQEKDLIDYSKLYNFFKIKSTPKCYIVKFYNVKSDHHDTTLKSLRFKKP